MSTRSSNFLPASDNDDQDSPIQVIEPTTIEPAIASAESLMAQHRDVIRHTQPRRRVVERTNPLDRQKAFLYGYLVLVATLGAGSLAASWLFAWSWALWGLVWLSGSLVGYIYMHHKEHAISDGAIQRRVIELHGTIQLRQERHRHREQMTALGYEHQRQQAQHHFNAVMRNAHRQQIQAQVERHSQPQSVKNQLANYRPPADPVIRYDKEALEPPPFVTTNSRPDIFQGESGWTLDGPTAGGLPLADLPLPEVSEEESYYDSARAKLLDFLALLYRKDDYNEFIHIKSDGYVKKGVVVPWSKRGGMNATEKRQVFVLLDSIAQYRWLLRQEGRMPWQLNVKQYRRFDQAADIVDHYDTLQ